MNFDLLKPDTMVAGRFRIRGVVSTGSFGIVYRARDLERDEDVALKVLHRHALDMPDQVARFDREARLGDALDHPHIVKLLNAGEFTRRKRVCQYLALELIAGLPLGDLIDARGCLGPEETVHILAITLDALDAVHRLGAIHRDLKPDNIIVEVPAGCAVPVQIEGSIAGRVGVPELDAPVWRDLTRCEVKLLDFGLGKFLAVGDREITKVTATGTAAGTLYYMSPEQIQARKTVDYRADL
ncbi:MAG: serine/threonine-protein kinase, partial [Myxococcota bacterium]|nr:serine/threonine-protein kinase [Myxococcota bacterium]